MALLAWQPCRVPVHPARQEGVRHASAAPLTPGRPGGRCLALAVSALAGARRKATRVPRHESSTWPLNDSCEVNYDEALSGLRQRSVALILNRNAKGVNQKVEQKLMKIVGPSSTFVCCCEEDAEHALRKVMADPECKVVVCGGGDGTVTSLLNMMARLRSEGATQNPAMCVLRLGTGNALAYVTGAQKDYLKDLEKLVKQEKVSELPTSTLEIKAEGIHSDAAEGTHCFFAGLGYDARMLQDYMWLRDKTKENRFLSKMLHNPLGYLVALVLRTLPATMRGEHVFHVKVTNLASEAFAMDPRRGDWALSFKKGSVIYEGDVGIAAVGAVPFYGGGFRLFPFAAVRPGFAHLRLSHIHPAVATFNIRHLWQGTYRNYKHVHDFLVKDVVVEVDRPTPLHHSGDFMGTASKVRFQVSESGETRLVDFFD